MRRVGRRMSREMGFEGCVNDKYWLGVRYPGYLVSAFFPNHVWWGLMSLFYLLASPLVCLGPFLGG